MKTKKLLLIEPSSAAYENDKLFNDPILNRDDCLLPIIRLKDLAEQNDYEVHTADFLRRIDKKQYSTIDYYSLGVIPDFSKLAGVNLKAYLLMEPPVVQPKFYEQLPELTKHFERVYLHNTAGDGYSLHNVDRDKLHQFYWPQPFNYVLENYWANEDRLEKIVIINGRNRPRQKIGELYSARLKALAELSKFDFIDLYGRGWDKYLNSNSLWWPNIRYHQAIRRTYKGACESKYAILSQYQFCLCFENMVMKGYITEKIFDCFYAGTIPIYWGAPDIDSYIPKDTFIDYRQFKNTDELVKYLKQLTVGQINHFRSNARHFIESSEFNKYYHGFENLRSL